MSRMTQEYSQDNKIYLKDVPLVVLPLDKSGKQITDKAFLASFKLESLFYHVEPINGQFVANFDEAIVEACSRDNMTPENYDLLSKEQDPSSYICVNPFYRIVKGQKERYDLYFYNPTGFYKSAFVNLKIGHCDEATNPECSKPFEEANYFFMNQFIFQSYIDLEDFAQPSKKYLTSMLHEIAYSMFTRIYVQMSVNEVLTDEGVIFTNNSEEVFYSMSGERNATKVSNEADRFYGVLYFEVSFMKNIYLRRYLKLQEALANVGGFMKAAVLLCQLLAKLTVSTNFLSDLVKIFL